MPSPDAATRHYLEQKAITSGVTRRAQELWSQVDVNDLDGSWRAVGPQMTRLTSGGQLLAAGRADAYLDAVIDELGVDARRSATIAAQGFAGVASDGRSLAGLLQSPIVATKQAMARTRNPTEALASGEHSLVRVVATQMQDAGRSAVAAGMVARPAVTGYTRMLVVPSCSRCVVLAGRFYRWNAGFDRHPLCDCRHIPANEATAGDLTTNPRAYFDSLDPADQDRYFTPAGAESIRNGADIGQVVNARRKGSVYTAADNRLATRSSTTKRGRSPGFRLMPEQIIAEAKTREEAIAGLQRYGYLARSSTQPATLPLEQPSTAAATARRTKATVTDPDVLAEAARRGVTPDRVVQLREERAVRRAAERNARQAAERELSATHPDVVRVAERYNVHPDEVLSARQRVADVRAVAREEAAKVQADAMRELDRLDSVRLRNPPRKGTKTDLGTAARRGEWDWLETLSDREKNRLSRQWYGGVSAPDQMAHTMSSILGRDIDVDEAVEKWLGLNRRAEAAGALRRGKIPSLDAYSGQIDPQELIGSLADDGFDAERLFGDELDAAGHIASVERQLSQDDAYGYLGDAVNAVEGPAPYRMGFQSWEEEVRDLEFAVNNGVASSTQYRRLGELVPRLLDEDGLDYEDLYSRILTTARKAGEVVPAHAFIPW